MAAWGKPWQPGDSDYTSASLTSLLSKVEPAVLLYLAIGPALDHTEEGNPFFSSPAHYIALVSRALQADDAGPNT